MTILRYIYKFVFIIFLIFAFLMSPKSEKLVCNVSEKVCNLETTNHMNRTSVEFLVNPYDVADVKTVEYTETRRSSGRHRRTYRETYYDVYFVTKSEKKIYIFRRYRSLENANRAKEELIRKFRSGNKIIEVKK